MKNLILVLVTSFSVFCAKAQTNDFDRNTFYKKYPQKQIADIKNVADTSQLKKQIDEFYEKMARYNTDKKMEWWFISVTSDKWSDAVTYEGFTLQSFLMTNEKVKVRLISPNGEVDEYTNISMRNQVKLDGFAPGTTVQWMSETDTPQMVAVVQWKKIRMYLFQKNI